MSLGTTGIRFGSYFFYLYVNDLPQALKLTKVLMYADDTALLYAGTFFTARHHVETNGNDK